MTCDAATSRSNRGGESRENHQSTNLNIKCVPQGTSVLFGVAPEKNNTTVSEAELRVWFRDDKPEFVDLRTVPEGGTFAHNGTDMFLFARMSATWRGCVKKIDFGGQGTPYYAWRIKNNAGWSNWSDGNKYPSRIVWYCETQSGTADSGPPADWTVCVREGVTPDTWIVEATRPATNGRVLLFWAAQIKDASTGSWRKIDANAGAAVTYYDGSAIAHNVTENPWKLTRASGTGFGTAAVGHLLLVDVRGGTFDADHSQWATIDGFEDADGFDVAPASAVSIRIGTALDRVLVTSDVRAKVVLGPEAWTSEGYLGGESNHGVFGGGATPDSGTDDIIGDTFTQRFITKPIEVPGGVTNVEARVWFDNMYSRSDDSLNTSGTLCAAGGGGGGGLCDTAEAKEIAVFTAADEACGYPEFTWDDANGTLLAAIGFSGDLGAVYDSVITGYNHSLGTANIDECVIGGGYIVSDAASMFDSLVVADTLTLGEINYSLVTGYNITLAGLQYSWLGGQTINAGGNITNSVVFAGADGFTAAATASFMDCCLIGSGFDFENDWENLRITGFGLDNTVNSGAHLDYSFFFGDSIAYDGDCDFSTVFALSTYDPDTTLYWGGHVMTDIKGIFVVQGNGAFWRISGTAAGAVTADNSGGDLDGNFIIRDLPTSDPGVTGALYVDVLGFVKRSP